MSVLKERAKKTEELVEELLVIRNILFRFEFDDIASNESLFVAFVNEMPNPPKTPNGSPVTYMGYRQMMKRIDENKVRTFIEKITSEPVAYLF